MNSVPRKIHSVSFRYIPYLERNVLANTFFRTPDDCPNLQFSTSSEGRGKQQEHTDMIPQSPCPRMFVTVFIDKDSIILDFRSIISEINLLLSYASGCVCGVSVVKRILGLERTFYVLLYFREGVTFRTIGRDYCL